MGLPGSVGLSPYSIDLVAQEQRVSPILLESVQHELRAIDTPLIVKEWVTRLDIHPDQELKTYLSRNMTQGFRIGLDYENHTCRSVKANMHDIGHIKRKCGARVSP